MTHRPFAAALLAGAMSLTLIPAATVAAPAAAAYKLPRTSWGAPDLQGYWTNSSLTTLERPAALGERKAYTPEEVAKLEGARVAEIADSNKPTDVNLKVTDLPVDCGRGFVGVSCGYNGGFIDPGDIVNRVNGEPRTSFITSTPNGRIPAALPRPAGSAAPARRANPNDNPETRSLGERCLMSFGNSSGPIMLPQLYNSNYQIVQSKDSVAINVEMVHDTRIVRLNVPHRTDGVRPWMGDSIGHYEGDTLVVETTNYHPSQSFRGSDQNLKVTERFTRKGPNRLLYQFTINDPTVWATDWGGEYEFYTSKGQVYEYACHEGNYALEGILAGARNDEAVAAKASAARAGTQ